MSEQKVASTQDQREYDRQQSVSFRFLQVHPEFKSSEANTNQIRAFMEQSNRIWDLDNLEVAFSALKDNLDLYTAAELEKPIPITPVKKEQPFPWPTPLTKPFVAKMSGEQYLTFAKGPHGKEFKRQVEALGFKKG